MTATTLLDTLVREIRFGFRMLRLNPTFAVVTLLTLAIGIGANVAVFSVVNAVLLRPDLCFSMWTRWIHGPMPRCLPC